jgi:hypothetical protein
LIGRQLGHPPKTGKVKLDSGERNLIERKFAQTKTGYGLGLIKGRLQGTSESWVSMIILVRNLVGIGAESLFFVMFLNRITEEINVLFFESLSIWAMRKSPRNRLLMTY